MADAPVPLEPSGPPSCHGIEQLQGLSLVVGHAALHPTVLPHGKSLVRSVSSPVDVWEKVSLTVADGQAFHASCAATTKGTHRTKETPGDCRPSLQNTKPIEPLSDDPLPINQAAITNARTVPCTSPPVEFSSWRCLLSPQLALDLTDREAYASFNLTLDTVAIMDCSFLPSAGEIDAAANTEFPNSESESPMSNPTNIGNHSPTDNATRSVLESEVVTARTVSIPSPRDEAPNDIVGVTRSGAAFALIRQTLLPYVKVAIGGRDVYRSRVACFNSANQSFNWNESVNIEVVHPWTTITISMMDKDFPDEGSTFVDDELLGSLQIPVYSICPDVLNNMSVDLRCCLPERLSFAACHRLVTRSNAMDNTAGQHPPKDTSLMDYFSWAFNGERDIHPSQEAFLKLRVQYQLRRRKGAIGEIAALSLPPVKPFVEPTPFDAKLTIREIIALKEETLDTVVTFFKEFHRIVTEVHIAPHPYISFFVFLLVLWAYRHHPARAIFLSLFLVQLWVRRIHPIPIPAKESGNGLFYNEPPPAAGTTSTFVKSLLALDSATAQSLAIVQAKIISFRSEISQYVNFLQNHAHIFDMIIKAVLLLGAIAPHRVLCFARLLLFGITITWFCSALTPVAILLRCCLGVQRFIVVSTARAKSSSFVNLISYTGTPISFEPSKQ